MDSDVISHKHVARESRFLLYLRKVSKVERVVAFRRGRKQLARDALVNLHRCRYQGLRKILQGGHNSLEEAPQNSLENPVEGTRGQSRQPDHGKVPKQPRGDLVPPAARGGARRQENNVLDALEEQFLRVVEPAGVYRLPKELVGGLSPVDL